MSQVCILRVGLVQLNTSELSSGLLFLLFFLSDFLNSWEGGLLGQTYCSIERSDLGQKSTTSAFNSNIWECKLTSWCLETKRPYRIVGPNAFRYSWQRRWESPQRVTFNKFLPGGSTDGRDGLVECVLSYTLTDLWSSLICMRGLSLCSLPECSAVIYSDSPANINLCFRPCLTVIMGWTTYMGAWTGSHTIS